MILPDIICSNKNLTKLISKKETHPFGWVFFIAYYILYFELFLRMFYFFVKS